MTAPADHRRARLARYAPWIARDYLMNQGPSTLIVLLLVGFLAMQGAGGPAQFRQMPEQIATRVMSALLGTLAFLGTFFATNGIIANDRKFSFYRFLFSKPVSPLAYYATVFAVYGAGLLVVTGALLGIWALVVRPMFEPALFAAVALMYVAYGGIGFLLSAAWRFDWLSLITVILVANVSWDLGRDSSGFGYWLLHLLPPVHKTDGVYAAVLGISGKGVPWGDIAWLGGYGLACFAAGLFVLRLRSFATS